MHRFHARGALVATVLAGALALAACGSSSKSSTGTNAANSGGAYGGGVSATTTPATAAPAATNATVAIATTKLGKVLVDDKGMTVYRFDADTTPGTSACTGGCATLWPAVTVTGTPSGASGVAKLAVITRADGTKQVAIAGHPLYTYKGDTKAGDTNGQGIAGKWYAVTATGDKAGDNS